MRSVARIKLDYYPLPRVEGSTVSFFAVRLRGRVWAEFTVHILSKFLGNRLYPVEESETGEYMESQPPFWNQ